MERGGRNIKVIFSILGLAIVLVIFFFVYDLFLPKNNDLAENKQPTQETKVSTTTADSLPTDKQLDYLKKRGNVSESIITDRTKIATKDLPKDVLLLLNQQTNIDAESVTFDDGKKGYVVSFDLENSKGQNLEEAYLVFFKSFDRNLWKIVSGSYTKNAGIIRISSPDFDVTVEFTQGTGTNIDSKMIVKSK